MTRHFIAPDGYGESALWAEDPPRLYQPVLLVSKRQVGQVGWDLIEKGLAAEASEFKDVTFVVHRTETAEQVVTEKVEPLLAAVAEWRREAQRLRLSLIRRDQDLARMTDYRNNCMDEIDKLEARIKAVYDHEMCPSERLDCCCRTIWRLLGLT